jgi:hypothetical protein
MPVKGMSPKKVVGTEMHKFKRGDLHSGSKNGPKVKKRSQAVAIAMSEARKAGQTPRSPGEYGPDPVGRSVAAADVALPHPAHGMRRGDSFNMQAPSAFTYGDWEYEQRVRDRSHVAAPLPEAPPKLGPYPAPAADRGQGACGYRGERHEGHLRTSGDPRAHRIGRR